MPIRLLKRHEIESIWRIDRSEVHHAIYALRNGELVLTPAYFDLQGWPPGHVEQDTPKLYSCFDRGGAFVGLFDGEQLAGAAVVDNVALGPERDQIQLKYLYVSQPYRKQGVGKRLMAEARTIARERGAKFLYISATPTENTINFYRGCGAVLNATPDPELYRLEPEDIHLLCPV